MSYLVFALVGLATSWTHLIIWFVTLYCVCFLCNTFCFLFITTFITKCSCVCVCVCVYCNLKTNKTQLINGWTLKICSGCCQLMEQWNVISHLISLKFVDHLVAAIMAFTVVAQLIKFSSFCGIWRFISIYVSPPLNFFLSQILSSIYL